jgi:hypothetical protein
LKEETMKRSPFPGAVSLGAALALLSSVAGAQTQTPPYFVIHQEVAKPSMIKEYEATSSEFVALVKVHKAKMPHFSFNAFASPDFTYTFAAPIPNLAGLDAINADFGALAQAAGAPFLDLNKRSGAAVEYIRESVIQLAPELSYSPAESRIAPGSARYFHYTLYYVMPGREPEAEAVGADYVKLFKARGVKTGYSVYKTVMGPEMPLYIVSVGALDAADYHADDAKVTATLGAEMQALGARLAALTRRVEMREAVVRPDLSVPR